jgi:carboxymethylenebutenolidase
MSAEWIDLQRPDGSSFPAYYALPLNARPAAPSIVLAMHLWGVDGQLRDTARRFAAAGFVVLAPDLYARVGAPSGDGAVDYLTLLPYAKQLTFETVDPEVRAAAAFLREHHPHTKTAIAGFCMGGTMAWRRTNGYRDIFAAAAIWYGVVPETDPALVDIPVIGSFGADDSGIPLARVRAFFDGIQTRSDMQIYPHAGHGFFDERRSSYEPVAAAASWTRTLAFLKAELT